LPHTRQNTLALCLRFASRLPGRTVTDGQVRTCTRPVRPRLVRTASRIDNWSETDRDAFQRHSQHSRPGYPKHAIRLSLQRDAMLSSRIKRGLLHLVFIYDIDEKR
jgi:hypothetical protein